MDVSLDAALAAAIGALSAISVELLRIYRDRHLREQGRRRTRRGDWRDDGGG